MNDMKLRAWKINGAPNASYDTFTLSELMSGKWEYQDYTNWNRFIGLLDKNGVEIYEGDILKIPTHSLPGEHFLWEVRWNGYHWGCIKYGEARFKGDVVDGGFGRPTLLWVEAGCSEVIGNIHDNPELLKEAT